MDSINLKKDLVLVFIIFILVCSIIPLTVHSDDNPEPFIYEVVESPYDGMGGNSFTIRKLNDTFFINLFKNHADWLLEYKRYSYSDWSDGSNYLTIQKTWDSDNDYWKFNLILDVPVNIYSARFTFGVDLPVLDYVEKVGQYKYLLNYSIPDTDVFYVCMFNWSDIVTIPNIVITHGIQNNMFWFRFKKDNIPSGHYEFDPVFGIDTAYGWYSSNENRVNGVPVDGVGDYCAINMSAYLGADYNHLVKMALYDNSTKDLIAVTEEKTVNTGGATSFQWITFDFSSPVPIYDEIEYLFACFGESTTNSLNLGYSVVGDCWLEIDYEVYGNFPDPFGVSAQNGNSNYMMLCGYTSCCEEECIINETSENPTNGTLNVDNRTGFMNVSVWVNETCGTIDFVNITLGGLGYHNVTSPSSGIFYYNYTGYLDCYTNYTWYVNTSCDGTHNNSYYWFYTKGCCECLISGESPSNKSTNVNNQTGYINLTIDVNNSCETIDFVNISFNGQYHNVSDVGNGTFYLNYTGYLDCYTNYTWYVNTSCDFHNGSVFWFFTKPCCECFISNFNIGNGSTNIDIDTVNFTFTVNSSCGDIDYVNISLLNCSHNVSDVGNGTFYLNISGCNELSSFTEYYVYVNTSCNTIHNNSWFYFYTEVVSNGTGCGCDDIEELIDEVKAVLNQIKGIDFDSDTDSLSADFMLNPSMIGVMLIFLFFFLAERKEDYILFVFSGVISFVMGVYFLGQYADTNYNIWIGIVLFLFGVYVFYLGFAYGVKNRGNRKG